MKIEYMCPYNMCEIVSDNHEICNATRTRLKAMAPETVEEKDDEMFLIMFGFNIQQWCDHKGYASPQSIPR